MNNKQKMSTLFQTPIPPWICVPLYISCLQQHSYAEKIDWNKTNKKKKAGMQLNQIRNCGVLGIVVNALLSRYSAPVKYNCSGDRVLWRGKSRIFLHKPHTHFPRWGRWTCHSVSAFFCFLSYKIGIMTPFLLPVAPSDLWINHAERERSIFKDSSVTGINPVSI